MSAITQTTRGGVSYEDLCKGTFKSYSFNLVDLGDNPPLSFQTAVDTLVRQIDDTFKDITTQQWDKEIESFTIGKSHARRRRKAGGGFQHFDHTDQHTWKLSDGVNARWRNMYSPKPMEYSGLVALTAVTTDMIPLDVKRAYSFINVEQYSIALEQRLIQHYMLERVDSRLENKSFNPGNLCESQPYAGIVYVAYKLKDCEVVQSDDHTTAQAIQEPSSRQSTSSFLTPEDHFQNPNVSTDELPSTGTLSSMEKRQIPEEIAGPRQNTSSHIIPEHDVGEVKTGNVVCRLCKQTFVHEHYLKFHMEEVHDNAGQNQYKSYISDKAHSRKRQSSQVCRHCGKMFSDLSTLKRHLKRLIETKLSNMEATRELPVTNPSASIPKRKSQNLTDAQSKKKRKSTISVDLTFRKKALMLLLKVCTNVPFVQKGL
ncbi:uncharacterized protein [Amphiura filiformis]|uniref:uncharacterized protein n=1 Tax=Amphiura filiformis TaxID=82378 RepID=UPI003B20E861